MVRFQIKYEIKRGGKLQAVPTTVARDENVILVDFVFNHAPLRATS